MAACVWLWLISLRPVSVRHSIMSMTQTGTKPAGPKPPRESLPLAWTRHTTVPLPRRGGAADRHDVPFPLRGSASCDHILPALFLLRTHHQTLFSILLRSHTLFYSVPQVNKFIFSAVWNQQQNMVRKWEDLNISTVAGTESAS